VDILERATRIGLAIASGKDLEAAGVPDDAASRQLWADIGDSMSRLPDGAQADIPSGGLPFESRVTTALKAGPYRYRHGWIKLDPEEITGDDAWNSDEGKADLSDDAVSKIRGGWFGSSFLKTQEIAASPKKYNTPPARKNASWDAAHAMQDSMTPSTRPMVLHRGVKDGNYTFGTVGSKVGKTYKGRGFTATTSDDSGKMAGQYSDDDPSYPDGKPFNTKTVIHIHAPAGTPMLKGDERLTPIPDELKEHVLPIGTKFKVLSDTVSTDPADIAAHNQHVKQYRTNAIRHVEVQVVR
jgi:hypothetical protein